MKDEIKKILIDAIHWSSDSALLDRTTDEIFELLTEKVERMKTDGRHKSIHLKTYADKLRNCQEEKADLINAIENHISIIGGQVMDGNYLISLPEKLVNKIKDELNQQK